MIKKSFLLLLLFFYSMVLWGQDKDGVSMADEMRSNGKIYVVVAVVLTIFAGMIFYLIRLDRKISRIEKDIQNNHFNSK